jgi:DNA-binding transcriptional LysR family regulator
MNTSFLRYFLAAAEAENFTRAAQRLHVTQPTLSAGIARLEEMLGARLLERGRQVRLTAAGSRFLPRAQAMLAEWQQAQADLRSEQPRQRLRLMASPTLPMAPITLLAARLRQAAPDIELELSEGSAPQAASRLAANRIDAALCEFDAPLPGCQMLPLLREAYGIGIATTHPLATRDRCRIADLAGIAFVWRSQCEEQERARRAFAEHGLRPRIVLRTPSEERAGALVVAGLGACFLPDSLITPGMAFLTLVELPLERRIGLVWRRDNRLEAISLLRRLARESRWSGQPESARPDPALAH